jgi:hypothetical protein
MTPRLAPLVVCLAACGTAPLPSEPQTLELEPFSPPQYTSRDVFVGGAGDVVVMSSRISRDGGQTWRALDARLGEPTRVAVTGTTVTTYASGLGVARWDLASDAIASVAGAPSYASDRTWRVAPGGALRVFDPINNAIAVERTGAWTTGALPQPSPTETMPYILDLEDSGSVMMTVSAWGVHRSTDGGTTWKLVLANPGDAGRDLLVMPDKRFVLIGGATTYLYDATGAAAGTLPGTVAQLGEASVCDDGAIVLRDQRSTDLGATWQPLVKSGDLSLIVERIGCAGSRYWMLARSDAWGYRLVTFTPGSPALAAGNWEGDTPSWNAGGPPIARAADGTFLVAGLAWREGDAAWTLREIPPRAWTAGDMAFGVAKGSFYASHDQGATWAARPTASLTPELAEALARTADGALLVSTFTSDSTGDLDNWHAMVWRSTDDGATWTAAYDARATRDAGDDATGEVHRFVGITAAGAWVATDAISKDGGATWEETDVKIDRGLAFLTPRGRLLTVQSDWQVYDEAGAGGLQATYQLEIEGTRVDGAQLRSVAFDDLGYAYVAGGSPYVTVWRSKTPLD